jgi:adenosine kinase
MIVTGSIAYDYLMSFPGSFAEHLLPDQLARVSLSFLVDTMEKRRGGCAPNIAYTLALLGEKPQLMATAGQDFSDYRAWLDSVGVDTTLVREVPGKFTASFFCSTDAASNQIASFYTGAMAHAAELSFRPLGRIDLVIISPNDPRAMTQYAEECRTMKVRFIADPGQQCARMEGDELLDSLTGAFMVICNDYEFELIRQKTGLSEQDVLRSSELLVVTKGEHGATVMTRTGTFDVPAVPVRQIADPTGVGDAYRGGFMKGLSVGAEPLVCAQLGSVAAAYALEHVGGQSHAYTWDEFRTRYQKQFGALAEV